MLTVMQGYTTSTTIAALLRFLALFTELYTSTFFARGSLLGWHMLCFTTLCVYVSFSGLVYGHTLVVGLQQR